MSTIDVSVEPELARPAPPFAPITARSSRVEIGRWARVALACAVLAASGGVRWWQARRVEDVLRDGRIAPFPLDRLPMTIGSWRGVSTSIDSKIARRTGATDLITRRYVDQATGATLEAIILYGPSSEVHGHVPEQCYPAAGYERVEGPDARLVRAGAVEAPFRALVYTKGEGGQAERQEVYYSWRYSGRWTPELGVYKHLERVGGMIKVHLARPVSVRERRDVGNPCEAFLAVLIPELERCLAASASAKPPSAPSRQPSEGPAR